MSTNESNRSKRYLSEVEIAKLDASTLTPEHPQWGTYLRPPLERHPACEQFLDGHGIVHEDFANWIHNNLLACTHFSTTAELLALATLFARYRHEGAVALKAAHEAARCIDQARKGADAGAVAATTCSPVAAQMRSRREQAATSKFERITTQLRALSGSTKSLDDARRIRDRYARAIGVATGTGGEALTLFLLSSDAQENEIEDIDQMMQSLALAQGDATDHAAQVIARARGN